MFKRKTQYRVYNHYNGTVWVERWDRWLGAWRIVETESAVTKRSGMTEREWAQTVVDLDAKVRHRKPEITWFL